MRISSPGSSSAIMANSSTCLAPGVITTFAAWQGMFRRLAQVSATALRNSGRPAAGP
jgi:hypothetical protein